MKVFYGTTTDINYLVRALCLYDSFSSFLENKIFGFYCMDDESARVLESLALPSSVVVRISDIETPLLASLRGERARNEYCWTCKPVLIEDALWRIPDLGWAVYLDSDMMAFSDPDVGFPQTECNVVVTPHRFATKEFAAFEKDVGTFNGGCVAFRNSEVGKEAIRWWKERCIERCSNVPVEGTYSDQRYLNELPELFENVECSSHVGLNAAPWNIETYAVDCSGGNVCLNGTPLLLYHFQGLRIHGTGFYDLYPGNMKLTGDVRRCIYRPYIDRLKKTFARLRSECGDFRFGIDPLLSRPRRILTQTRRVLLGLNNLALN